MTCNCFYLGCSATVFRLLLICVIVFECNKAASPTILNLAPSLRHFSRKSHNQGNFDIIHVGVEPKIITLKTKTILSYSYNHTASGFLIVQAHTQYRKLLLSTCDGKEKNTNYDTAILKIIASQPYPKQSIFTRVNDLDEASHRLDYVLNPPNDTSVEALVVVVMSSEKAPIPGGCCLTCSMDMDPNLIITSKQYYKSILSFSLANVYNYNTSDCSGYWPKIKPRHYRLQYSIYQYFLEEGNLGNDQLFDGISRMLTPGKVKENGKKIRDWNPETDKPSQVFDTRRGQGMVFNILLYDPVTGEESVYSPAVTYGCSFTAKVDGCDSLGSIANIVLASCGGLLGLFVCFLGVRFYRIYFLGSGLTFFSFIGFLLLTSETEWSHDVRMTGSVCVGVIGALLIYLLWWWTGYKYVVLYICGLPFGFLLSAVVFFTPFGNLHYWKNDINYWTVFLCMSITVPCIFLICLKTFAIFASSFVGAYGFVVGIDTFLRSSMTYIILNVIMKATVDDFVQYDVPFQTKGKTKQLLW